MINSLVLHINKEEETLIIQYTYDTLFDDEKVRESFSENVVGIDVK